MTPTNCGGQGQVHALSLPTPKSASRPLRDWLTGETWPELQEIAAFFSKEK